jgi:hypothetical protein
VSEEQNQPRHTFVRCETEDESSRNNELRNEINGGTFPCDMEQAVSIILIIQKTVENESDGSMRLYCGKYVLICLCARFNEAKVY